MTTNKMKAYKNMKKMMNLMKTTILYYNKIQIKYFHKFLKVKIQKFNKKLKIQYKFGMRKFRNIA